MNVIMDKEQLDRIQTQFLDQFGEATTKEQIEKLDHWEALREYLAIPLKDIADDIGIDRSVLQRYMHQKMNLTPQYRNSSFNKGKMQNIYKSYSKVLFKKLSKIAQYLYGKK